MTPRAVAGMKHLMTMFHELNETVLEELMKEVIDRASDKEGTSAGAGVAPGASEESEAMAAARERLLEEPPLAMAATAPAEHVKPKEPEE
eukprot:12568012-Alexandrium_andersonii.AAC.1